MNNIVMHQRQDFINLIGDIIISVWFIFCMLFLPLIFLIKIEIVTVCLWFDIECIRSYKYWWIHN